MAPGPAEVPDNETLYRLIDHRQIGDHGEATGFAFKFSAADDGCSAWAASIVPLDVLMARNPNRGVASVRASDVRAAGAEAIWDEGENPGHVLITGNRNKFPRELARRAIVLKAPPAPSKTASG